LIFNFQNASYFFIKSSLQKNIRSRCPVAGVLDLLGDRWTLLVIRDLVLGKQRFDEFLASPEGIATNILSQRLRWLTAHQIIESTPDSNDGRKKHYSLTEKGESLRPVLRSIAQWGIDHIEGTAIHPSFKKKS